MSVVVEPAPYRWTRDEYYRIGELGLFDGKRVELLDGEIVEMSPINSGHSTAVALVAAELSRAFGPGHHCRIQQPLALGEFSEPEPDLACVSGQIRDYAEAHPRTAVIIVEVAFSSLEYDRGEKARVYAQANIPEYWIVDLGAPRLGVYREPLEGKYARIAWLSADEAVSPVGAPAARIEVAALLPRRN